MTSSAEYLGIDVGTQSLTALVVEVPQTTGAGVGAEAVRATGIIARAAVHYDSELPHYGTVYGQLPNDDPAVGRAPPGMWIEALDLALERLGSTRCGQIRGVSVSGQQHGSVYLRSGADRALRQLSPQRSLTEQIVPLFSRPEAPIWTDSSTGPECARSAPP